MSALQPAARRHAPFAGVTVVRRPHRPRPRRALRGLAVLATLTVALVLTAALIVALVAPGSFDITTLPGHAGHPVVSWVAPDGPAGSVGIAPGEALTRLTVPGRTAGAYSVQAGDRRIILPPTVLTPTGLDLLDTGLGVCLLVLGLVIRLKATMRAAARAFWRMCLRASFCLALNPAGTHGTLWAIVSQALALKLFGPALLDLALTFPTRRERARRRAWRARLLWLPALILALLYPAYLISSGRFVAFMPFADGLALGGYLLAACVSVALRCRQPLPARERAQMQWLALGLLGGFLPFETLTLLPLAVAGRPLVAPEASILALALLPLAVGIAILRAEFLGVVSALRRSTVHALVLATLMVGLDSGAGFAVAAVAHPWTRSLPAVVAGTSVLTLLLFLVLRPRLLRLVDRLTRREAYDAGELLAGLLAESSGATQRIRGDVVVQRLTTALGLTDAVLLVSCAQWSYVHPHGWFPVATRQATVRHLYALMDAARSPKAGVMRIAGQRLLIQPVQGGAAAMALLCLGPKRNGERFSAHDQALVEAVARFLALHLFQATSGLESPTGSAHGAGSAVQQATSERESPAPMAGLRLTRREATVLEYVARGLSNKEIACQLTRDIRTVEKHLAHIFAKLEVHSRTEAVAVARHTGLLSLDILKTDTPDD